MIDLATIAVGDLIQSNRIKIRFGKTPLSDAPFLPVIGKRDGVLIVRGINGEECEVFDFDIFVHHKMS